MIDKSSLIFTGAVLILVIPIVIYIISIFDRRDRMKNNVGSSLAKGSNKDFRYQIYRYLNKFWLTRRYVDRIGRYYEMLYPGDIENMAKKTVNTVALSWIICTAAIGLIFLRNMNFNNTAVTILLVYVINSEIIGFMIVSTELVLLEEMAAFISNVRHNFYINRMVDDAILLSIRDIKRYEMLVHANKLYDIVTSSNLKEAVMSYNATMHNKYLKMFLSLCINIMEYNDKPVNGQNLFAMNLDNLKKEIDTQCIKLRKIRFKFSGISFVTIAVCVPIDAIRQYGISMVPELDSFYNGRIGIIYVSAVILIALCIYKLINQLKGTNEHLPGDYSYLKRLEKIKIVKRILVNYSDKHPNKMQNINDILKRLGDTLSPRQFLLKRMIYSIITLLLSILFFIYIRDVNRDNLTERVAALPKSIVSVNASQEAAIKETILRNVNTYKKEKIVNRDVILDSISKEGFFYGLAVKEAIADEIVRRIVRYQREYFVWYDFLVSIGLAYFAYFMPYWMLMYKKRVNQMSMEDEVNQLNSIIFMLMYSDHITVKDLLEEIELFAVVFKQTIQECINDYNSGDIEALEEMKEKESFGLFIRLVDNLIRCDSIAISKAFDEITSDRENYHERRKLENEISVQKRADWAQLMSWVPAVMVMIYLTIPMLVIALDALGTFREMSQNI